MNAPRPGTEGGFAAIGLLAMLLPLALAVGAYMTTMTGRNARLQTEIQEEQSIAAAEAGIDVALYQARRGALAHGNVFDETLPGGARFVAVATLLTMNGVDDDGNGTIDDATENVFRITSTGTHGNARRRVAAYLGYTTFAPTVTAAATIMNPNPTITVAGAAAVNGNNFLISGGAAGGATYGLAITPPGNLAALDSQLTGGERNKVTGLGSAPSIGNAPNIELDALVAEARNSANYVLTNGTLNTGSYGNGSNGTAFVTFRDGNLRIAGNIRGSGLLVVTGELRITGTFRWDGLIVVLGRFECGSGTAQIYGGVITGPASPELDLRGTIDLRYSAQAIALAGSLVGRYVAFNGWQEISGNN